ncbi:MAG: hypothetical protein DWB42_12240 [Chloroflexi bacterium]|jgi:hypothetical protein|nr:hypothetical protein [Chloroflexota bacterium]MDL1884141.1 hypothetical protein [Anaerolineae bacterium CFX8]
MGQTHQQPNVHYLLQDARLEAALAAIDDLHDAVSEGNLAAVTELSNRELIGWLHDLVYTAQETIAEIEKRTVCPPLRLIK